MDFRGSLFFGLPQVVFCGSLFGIFTISRVRVYYTHFTVVNQVSFAKKLLSTEKFCAGTQLFPDPVILSQILKHHPVDFLSQLHGVGRLHFFCRDHVHQMQPHMGPFQTLHVVE